MNNTTPKPNPKVTQFLAELDKLQKKYQYRLVPSIKWSSTGATPEVVLQEIVPPLTPEKPTKVKVVKPTKKKGKK